MTSSLAELKLHASGKVREIYEDGDELIMVASDRISVYDVILPTEIPDKGKVLTQMSLFWFELTGEIVPNHFISEDVPDEAAGRGMRVRRLEMYPIECVVRGYLSGSGWREYQETGAVCGIGLPSGLRESEKLPEPIFTPATKADQGEHDENIDFDAMIDHIGRNWIIPPDFAGPLAEVVRDQSIALYRYASAVAARGGIVLADTKFEFGVGLGPADDGPVGPSAEWLDSVTRPLAGRRAENVNGRLIKDQLILVDEALTPDSSRFWDAATYEPGRAQASFDKQFVRDWLEAQPWDKTAPGPELPDDVVAGTRARYVEAFERITGASFDRYLADDVIAR
jgi:phosphoribosylaminoimidazole-succinocarboxamide synthase